MLFLNLWPGFCLCRRTRQAQLWHWWARWWERPSWSRRIPWCSRSSWPSRSSWCLWTISLFHGSWITRRAECERAMNKKCSIALQERMFWKPSLICRHLPTAERHSLAKSDCKKYSKSYRGLDRSKCSGCPLCLFPKTIQDISKWCQVVFHLLVLWRFLKYCLTKLEYTTAISNASEQ